MSKQTNSRNKNTKASTSAYVKFNDFNIDNVIIHPMKQYPSGAKYFPIEYAMTEEDKEKGNYVPLNILSPEKMLHWGIKRFDSEDDWTLSVPLIEGVPAEFQQVFAQIDEKIKAFAFENSQSFFGAKKSKEVVNEFFSLTLKDVKDKRTGEVTKQKVCFKIPMSKSGEFKMLLCDEKKKPIFPPSATGKSADMVDSKETPDGHLPPKSRIKFIFNIPSVWISNGRYGYSKKFQQGIVYAPEQSMLSSCVIADSDEEDNAALSDDDDEDDFNTSFGIRSSDCAEEGEEPVKKASLYKT